MIQAQKSVVLVLVAVSTHTHNDENDGNDSITHNNISYSNQCNFLIYILTYIQN